MKGAVLISLLVKWVEASPMVIPTAPAAVLQPPGVHEIESMEEPVQKQAVSEDVEMDYDVEAQDVLPADPK